MQPSSKMKGNIRGEGKRQASQKTAESAISEGRGSYHEQIPNEKWYEACHDWCLRRMQKDGYAYLFQDPVMEASDLPHEVKLQYRRIIQKPMDYSTVERKLKEHSYQDPAEFKRDMELIYDNCMLFNPSNGISKWLHNAAKKNRDFFEKLWSRLVWQIYLIFDSTNQKSSEESKKSKKASKALKKMQKGGLALEDSTHSPSSFVGHTHGLSASSSTVTHAHFDPRLTEAIIGRDSGSASNAYQRLENASELQPVEADVLAGNAAFGDRSVEDQNHTHYAPGQLAAASGDSRGLEMHTTLALDADDSLAKQNFAIHAILKKEDVSFPERSSERSSSSSHEKGVSLKAEALDFAVSLPENREKSPENFPIESSFNDFNAVYSHAQDTDLATVFDASAHTASVVSPNSLSLAKIAEEDAVLHPATEQASLHAVPLQRAQSHSHTHTYTASCDAQTHSMDASVAKSSLEETLRGEDSEFSPKTAGVSSRNPKYEHTHHGDMKMRRSGVEVDNRMTMEKGRDLSESHTHMTSSTLQKPPQLDSSMAVHSDSLYPAEEAPVFNQAHTHTDSSALIESSHSLTHHLTGAPRGVSAAFDVSYKMPETGDVLGKHQPFASSTYSNTPTHSTRMKDNHEEEQEEDFSVKTAESVVFRSAALDEEDMLKPLEDASMRIDAVGTLYGGMKLERGIASGSLPHSIKEAEKRWGFNEEEEEDSSVVYAHHNPKLGNKSSHRVNTHEMNRGANELPYGDFQAPFPYGLLHTHTGNEVLRSERAVKKVDTILDGADIVPWKGDTSFIKKKKRFKKRKRDERYGDAGEQPDLLQHLQAFCCESSRALVDSSSPLDLTLSKMISLPNDTNVWLKGNGGVNENDVAALIMEDVMRNRMLKAESSHIHYKAEKQDEVKHVEAYNEGKLSKSFDFQRTLRMSSVPLKSVISSSHTAEPFDSVGRGGESPFSAREEQDFEAFGAFSSRPSSLVDSENLRKNIVSHAKNIKFSIIGKKQGSIRIPIFIGSASHTSSSSNDAKVEKLEAVMTRGFEEGGGEDWSEGSFPTLKKRKSFLRGEVKDPLMSRYFALEEEEEEEDVGGIGEKGEEIGEKMREIEEKDGKTGEKEGKLYDNERKTPQKEGFPASSSTYEEFIEHSSKKEQIVAEKAGEVSILTFPDDVAVSTENASFEEAKESHHAVEGSHSFAQEGKIASDGDHVRAERLSGDILTKDGFDKKISAIKEEEGGAISSSLKNEGRRKMANLADEETGISPSRREEFGLSAETLDEAEEKARVFKNFECSLFNISLNDVLDENIFFITRLGERLERFLKLRLEMQGYRKILDLPYLTRRAQLPSVLESEKKLNTSNSTDDYTSKRVCVAAEEASSIKRDDLASVGDAYATSQSVASKVSIWLKVEGQTIPALHYPPAIREKVSVAAREFLIPIDMHQTSLQLVATPSVETEARLSSSTQLLSASSPPKKDLKKCDSSPPRVSLRSPWSSHRAPIPWQDTRAPSSSPPSSHPPLVETDSSLAERRVTAETSCSPFFQPLQRDDSASLQPLGRLSIRLVQPTIRNQFEMVALSLEGYDDVGIRKDPTPLSISSSSTFPEKAAKTPSSIEEINSVRHTQLPPIKAEDAQNFIKKKGFEAKTPLILSALNVFLHSSSNSQAKRLGKTSFKRFGGDSTNDFEGKPTLSSISHLPGTESLATYWSCNDDSDKNDLERLPLMSLNSLMRRIPEIYMSARNVMYDIPDPHRVIDNFCYGPIRHVLRHLSQFFEVEPSAEIMFEKDMQFFWKSSLKKESLDLPGMSGASNVTVLKLDILHALQLAGTYLKPPDGGDVDISLCFGNCFGSFYDGMLVD